MATAEIMTPQELLELEEKELRAIELASNELNIIQLDENANNAIELEKKEFGFVKGQEQWDKFLSIEGKLLAAQLEIKKEAENQKYLTEETKKIITSGNKPWMKTDGLDY